MFISAINLCTQNRYMPLYKPDINKQKPVLSAPCLLPNVSFYGIKKDLYSFGEFQKAAKESGIKSLKDLTKNVRPENLIGTGANSSVYKFDNELLDRWVLKKDKKPFYKPCKKLFEPSVDELFGFNMGQEIAKAGDRYRILKRIEGTPHSIPNWSKTINNDSIVTREEAREFLGSLEKIQNFPQKSFDNYAADLKKLEDNGYKQDSINPNNLLIDYDKQIIHIIDFFKVADPSHINTKQDLISVLLDFSLFKNFHEQLSANEQKDLIKYSKNIERKCTLASKKAGLIQDEQTYINYLANVDKWFGFYLVDKGGDYRSRYKSMKEILNN